MRYYAMSCEKYALAFCLQAETNKIRPDAAKQQQQQHPIM